MGVGGTSDQELSLSGIASLGTALRALRGRMRDRRACRRQEVRVWGEACWLADISGTAKALVLVRVW